MQEFSDTATASAEAAALIAGCIEGQLKKRPRASIMVSGGSTPRQCYEILSSTPLPWESIDITLTDEREVAADHAERNERMLREQLLQGPAEAASFVDLASSQIEALKPFACTLVGMGEDGHFASLFPDSPELREGLRSTETSISVVTPSSPYLRRSATLQTICASELIILLAFGEHKRRLLEAANGYPIAHLLNQQQAPLKIIWAP